MKPKAKSLTRMADRCGHPVGTTKGPCVRPAGHAGRHYSERYLEVARRRQEKRSQQIRAMHEQVPRRRIQGRLVYVPEGEPPYILGQKVSGTLKKNLGEIRNCKACGQEFFWRQNSGRWEHCSRKCAEPSMKRTKRKQSLAKGGPTKDQLDKWFSRIVRSPGRCACCGATDQLQAAHIISRRYLGIRYSMDNAMCLCARCHMRFTYRPLEWEAFVIERMGEEAYRALKARALAFQGPLDRRAIAAELYEMADAAGAEVPGWTGWTGLTDTIESSDQLPRGKK